MAWLRRLSSFNSATTPPALDTTDVRQPTPENGLLFQSFEWHTPSEPPPANETHCPKSHWSRLVRILPSLAELGVSSIWLPPGCKANNSKGNGYDCYDLWDLGEFDQKWARSTKWGSREELHDLVKAAAQCRGIELIWDAVLNHKTAGDATDEVWAVEVDGEDRRRELCPPKRIEAWLKYDFPGRERQDMRYSRLKWRAEHFNGTDWDQKAQKNAIYKLIDDPETSSELTKANSTPKERSSSFKKRITGLSETFSRSARAESIPSLRTAKGWAEDVDKTFGNYDYLMFSNIYYAHPEVRTDILKWGRWMIEDTGIHGFRLDAAQHFSWNFTREWITEVQAASQRKYGKSALIVGEIWAAENSRSLKWLDTVTPPGSRFKAHAFDVPLLYSFSRISEDLRKRSPAADLRTILSGPGDPEKKALMLVRPDQAVTLVSNHDTQPGQTCFTPMDAGYKALFYAFILLRKEGLPCVFWGDLYGTHGPHSEPPACKVAPGRAGGDGQSSDSGIRSLLPSLMCARKRFAYGPQKDYIDSNSCIGWTRAGTHDRPGCVVVLSIMSDPKWASKRMTAGRHGERWVNILSQDRDKTAVVIDKRGIGAFTCYGTGVAVYVCDSTGTDGFPIVFDYSIDSHP